MGRIIRLPDGTLFEYPECKERCLSGRCKGSIVFVNPNQGGLDEQIYPDCHVVYQAGLCDKSPIIPEGDAMREVEKSLPDCGYRDTIACLRCKGPNGHNISCARLLVAGYCREGWR